jgi:hypothetical protein
VQSTAQPHFDATVLELGRPIHPDDFYILRPDKLFRLQRIHVGADRSENNRAWDLISIPLDVEFTRKLLRHALEKTYHSSRAIVECRKMLAFYLFKEQNEVTHDLLTFLPISTDMTMENSEIVKEKEAKVTMKFRPLTAGESMDFWSTSDNKIEVNAFAHVTRDSIISAYQALASQ